jgi:hypothetical protein
VPRATAGCCAGGGPENTAQRPQFQQAFRRLCFCIRAKAAKQLAVNNEELGETVKTPASFRGKCKEGL